MAEFKNELILQDASGVKVSIDLRNALVMSAAPTSATKARIGMQAYVVSGGTITAEYVCTAVSGSVYTWILREMSSGGGGSGGTFVATYDVTPYADVRAAYEAGQTVIVMDGMSVYHLSMVGKTMMWFDRFENSVHSRVTVDDTFGWSKRNTEISEVTGGIVESVSGETLTLTDAIDSPLLGLAVYGKSTYDGTAPAPIVSTFENGGGVYITDASGNNPVQTIPVNVEMCGVPVSSGGNYTDSSGQQWVCDEIDFGRGVKVQRTKRVRFSGASGENWKIQNPSKPPYVFRENAIVNDNKLPASNENVAQMLCDKFKIVKQNSIYDASLLDMISMSNAQKGVYAKPSGFTGSTNEEFTAWLASNPFDVVYILDTPIETPLTDDELAAYAELHTNEPVTTIYADGNAGLAVTYKADTKRYIDKKFDALAAAIINNA